MQNGKKMYKVLSPRDKNGGGTYWMRVGSAFTNRDDSINLYIDAVPAPNPKTNNYQFQIRELNDEDLRRRDEYNASHGRNATSPQASSSYGNSARDLGGLGGGPTAHSIPSTRAVTAGGVDENGIPF